MAGDPFNGGVDTVVSRMPRSARPYDEGTEEASGWLDGWDEIPNWGARPAGP